VAPNPKGKILIIGGGIANFTNVAATFKGIIRALKDFKSQLINHQVKIFVRRGGPNYQEGLKAMRLLGESLGVPIGSSVPTPTSPTSFLSLLASTPARLRAATLALTAEVSAGQHPTRPSVLLLASPLIPLGSIHPDGERTQPSDHIVHFDTNAARPRVYLQTL
jgi:ATP citrate (pro-S)-lyase